jgi:glycosyltransferase involved in cell wall biosynthesis
VRKGRIVQANRGSGVHVLCLIDSLVASGAERSLAGLVPRFVGNGMTIDVGYLHDRPGLQTELAAGGAGLFCLDGHGGRRGWWTRTARLVSARKPDLIHTTLFEAHLAGRVAGVVKGVPVVSTLAGLNYGPEDLGNPALRPWRVRAAQLADVATARAVDRFHAISIHVADVMAERLRIPRNRIDVVPRGRDPAELGVRGTERGRAARSRIGLSPNDRVVLAIARHDYKKGLDDLLHAFREVRSNVPEAKLVVAGRDGVQTSTLKRLAAPMGGAVMLLGDRSDVPDLLSMADAFVLPSRSEGFAGVLLEAMALEAPIIATDIPAVREVVGVDDAAVLIPCGDHHALATAISTTLRDPDAARTRSHRARARFLSRFTIDDVAERMLEFYERALVAA